MTTTVEVPPPLEIEEPEVAVSIFVEDSDAADQQQGDSNEGWETDLAVDEILKRRTVQNPYITACKVLGIVPVTHFAQNVTAPEIVLKHYGLGPKGAQAIAYVLEGNNTLAHLDLSDNWIESGGAFIGRSLQINRTLVHLNLANNRLGLQSGVELAEMLAFNACLKTLILTGNLLGDKEAAHLADGIKQNTTLQVLNLSRNRIGDLGAIALGAGLVSNDSLRELDLTWNEIRARGFAGFFSHLKENGGLARLSIQENGIGDSTQAIGAYLVKTNAIQQLNLSNAQIGDAGLVAIAKGLEQNSSAS
ncbi:hypothetical protein DFJ73DRAFT_409939 [Zopfochytrium polystomum]|nr:hypothetical protein DFJ73DRAFT_409939 [Zopfochytrium polystomum]